MFDRYFFERGGHDFESSMVEVIHQYARSAWGKGAITASTMKQDQFEGTDIFVLGVPVDITLAYEQKRQTRKLAQMSFDGITVEFGLRRGNGKSIFKTPVLVIGIEAAAGISYSNMQAVLGTIKHRIGDVINAGMDEYFGAVPA